MQSTAYSVCPLSISNFAGKIGVLLTTIAEIDCPDVLDAYTVGLGTVMADNICHLFLFAGETYLDR